MNNELINQQIMQLRNKWPQAWHEEGPKGEHLIMIPGFVMPYGYNYNICTVLFIAPPGFPAACPDGFWTDIYPTKLIPPQYETEELHDGPSEFGVFTPRWTDGPREIPNFPHWNQLTWWSRHLQRWDPNRDTLFTYANVVRIRVQPAR